MFFSGDKCWIPMEAARSENPIPVIDYAKVMKITKHPEWKWTMEFDMDLRRAFIAT
jgi:hypothetical protein